MAPAVFLTCLSDRPQVENPQPLSLFEGALEPLRIEDPSQVEQRARDAGDRNPIVDRSIFLPQSATVNCEPWPRGTGGAGDGDMDASAGRRKESPQRCRAPMAKQGVAAAAERCSHPAPAAVQAAVSDRINPPKNRIQPAKCEPMPDGSFTEAEGSELPAGDDSVLSPCKRRDTTLDPT
jgi:hypothetical protein